MTMPDIPIAEIKIETRHRRDLGDIPALAASITEHGLLHPIVVTHDYVLIVGQRRLVACESIGWETIPATVVDLDDPLGAELDENVLRKAFTPSEAYAIGEARRDLEEARAQARMMEGQKSGGRGKKKLPVDSTESFQGNARDAIAAAVGLSWFTYERIGCVVKAAEQDDDWGPLVEEMDATGNVTAAYNMLPAHLKLPASEAISRGKMPPRHLDVSTIQLKIDRFFEQILPSIRHLSEEDMNVLRASLEFYWNLLEAENKEQQDEA